MKKLDAPTYPSIELFDHSVTDLNDDDLALFFEANRPAMEVAYTAFDEQTLAQTWCNLPKARHGHSEDLVVGDLSKADLVNLYNKGVVQSKGEGRNVYDAIKISAHDECPYCGGVGEIGSLDHYLPKARFPAYSVLAKNLIPACDVCNKGMGSNFPSDPELQPLHPYFDAEHFFDEKWTEANVEETTPIVVNFGVAAPTNWTVKDKRRVVQHFADCNLAKRYRARVWSELAPLLSQRKTTLQNLTSDQFREHLFVVSNETSLPINGWKRTLYHALSASDWFINTDFSSQPDD